MANQQLLITDSGFQKFFLPKAQLTELSQAGRTAQGIDNAGKLSKPQMIERTTHDAGPYMLRNQARSNLICSKAVALLLFSFLSRTATSDFLGQSFHYCRCNSDSCAQSMEQQSPFGAMESTDRAQARLFTLPNSLSLKQEQTSNTFLEADQRSGTAAWREAPSLCLYANTRQIRRHFLNFHA